MKGPLSKHIAHVIKLAKTELRDIWCSEQRCFYLGFLFYLFSNCINRTTSDDAIKTLIVSALQILTLACYAAQIVKEPLQGRALFISVAAVGLALMIGVNSSSYTLLWLVLGVVCAQNVSLRRICIVVSLAYLSTLFFAVALALLGVIQNIAVERGTEGENVRYALGFSHPNQFGFFITVICCAYVCLRATRMRLGDYLFLLACAAVVLMVADSRTSVIGIMLLALFSFVSKFGVATGHASRLIAVACVVVIACATVSVILMVIYDDANPVMFSISKLLSSRPYYANYYFENYGIHLLGSNFSDAQRIVKNGVDTTLLLDNAFCMLLLRHGIVGFLMVIAPLAFLAARAAKEGTGVWWIMGMALFAILGLSENAFIDLSINYFLIGYSVLVHGGRMAVLEPAGGIDGE